MLNSVQLIGHLGADPEIRVTQSNDSVANVSIATTEKWKDKDTGVKKEKTEWHRLVFWPPLSGIVEQYARKGSLVFVAGKLQTRQWEKDGQNHYSTEIVVSQLKLLDKKPKDDGGDTQSSNEAGDDIPF